MGLSSRRPKNLQGTNILILKGSCPDSSLQGPPQKQQFENHLTICEGDSFAHLKALKELLGLSPEMVMLVSTIFALSQYLVGAGRGTQSLHCLTPLQKPEGMPQPLPLPC